MLQYELEMLSSFGIIVIGARKHFCRMLLLFKPSVWEGPHSHIFFFVAFLRRVFAHHYPADEGARPPWLRKGDARSFPNSQSKQRHQQQFGVHSINRRRIHAEHAHYLLSLRKWTPCALPITATCAANLWSKTPFWKWSMLKCASSASPTRCAHNIRSPNPSVARGTLAESFLASFLSHPTEPDHLVPFGPAAPHHSHQSVLQSAAPHFLSLLHVTVPEGENKTHTKKRGNCNVCPVGSLLLPFAHVSSFPLLDAWRCWRLMTTA